MNSFFKYFADIFTGVKSLLIGMTVTGKYFFSPGQIVTQQYPENRKTLKMFERFKGEVIMVHDNNNHHRCTGCGICELNCPNGSIEVISDRIAGQDGSRCRCSGAMRLRSAGMRRFVRLTGRMKLAL